jgi:glyoxylase-like metal-dependent hydrolase (beta-lactamase superfamily II)
MNFAKPFPVTLQLLCCWLTPSPAQKAVPLPSGEDLEVIEVQPNFYMIAGAGGNIAVQLGPDGILLVDTGTAQMTDRVLAEIRKLSAGSIRFIINTSAADDHAGGNEKLSRAVKTPLNGGAGPEGMVGPPAAIIIGSENLLNRMSAPTGKQAAFPVAAWPTDTFFLKQKPMYFNREGIQIIAEPGAGTDANNIVFFHRSDVIVAGDIMDSTHFPVIDIEKGGGIQQEIAALNQIIELAIPSIPLVWQEGGTRVIPGHGWVSEQADVVEYRDMVTIIRDRVQDLIMKGMTLEQVKAANPAQGYRSQYGSDSGPWTTDKFIEAIYRSLAPKK